MYNYVGDGVGAYEREDVITYKLNSTQSRCLCCLCCLLLALLVPFLWWLIQGFMATGNELALSVYPNVSSVHGATDRIVTPFPFLYNCEHDFKSWPTKWSMGKKKFCCKEYERGCPPTTTAPDYACNEGLANWRTGWSNLKKAYCCRHEHKGCEPLTSPAPTTKALPPPPTQPPPTQPPPPPPPPPTQPPPPLPPPPPIKKPMPVPQPRPVPVPAPAPAVARPAVAQPAVPPVAAGVPPTSLPFDCDAGLSNWKAGWSLGKITWCCQNQHKGCVEASTSACPPQDCNTAFGNWKAAWSVEKKAWCCQHVGKGCE